MGRELQKKKNKSGLRKVRRNPKKTSKPLLANSIIAAHWDRSQTLTQNYRRLGLTSKINAPTGGSEDAALTNPLDISQTRKPNGGSQRSNADTLSISNAPKQIAPREVRIERDPKTGAILRVVEDANAQPDVTSAGNKATAWTAIQDPLEELDAIVTAAADEDAEGGFDGFEDSENPDSIVRSMREQAARPAKTDKRTQSQRERAFLESLIAKYGTDEEAGCFEKMARDRDINIRQQSAGDLRKRIRKYLKDTAA